MQHKLIASFVFFLGFLFFTQTLKAQEKELLQFSGVLVSVDSLDPIPFATVLIKGSRRGTITDYYGFFSFVAQIGDTIQFSSVGYKKAEFVIPDSLDLIHYSIIQVLFKDTIQLSDAMIYPWPTKEQFKEAFMSLNAPDDDLERARKNLAKEMIREQFYGMPMDATANYKYQMQVWQTQLYNTGHIYPTTQLLNPIAWMRFVQAWKNGELFSK
jgi:hypothetical protein